MKKRLVFAALVVVTLLLVILGWSNRFKIYLRLATFGKPCGLYFLDSSKRWNVGQVNQVIKACTLYSKLGLGNTFDAPIVALLDSGDGGAYSTKDTIIFKMSDSPTEDFYPTSLHELAHIVDFRNNDISTKREWLKATGWVCSNVENLDTCQHPCKQYPDRSFYCDYRKIETLPSRFGTQYYDRSKTDVSINPTEDFAESLRYFLQANDELNTTSKSRCRYFRELYKGVSPDSCYDCNPKTVCEK